MENEDRIDFENVKKNFNTLTEEDYNFLSRDVLGEVSPTDENIEDCWVGLVRALGRANHNKRSRDKPGADARAGERRYDKSSGETDDDKLIRIMGQLQQIRASYQDTSYAPSTHQSQPPIESQTTSNPHNRGQQNQDDLHQQDDFFSCCCHCISSVLTSECFTSESESRRQVPVERGSAKGVTATLGRDTRSASAPGDVSRTNNESNVSQPGEFFGRPGSGHGHGTSFTPSGDGAHHSSRGEIQRSLSLPGEEVQITEYLSLDDFNASPSSLIDKLLAYLEQNTNDLVFNNPIKLLYNFIYVLNEKVCESRAAQTGHAIRIGSENSDNTTPLALMNNSMVQPLPPPESDRTNQGSDLEDYVVLDSSSDAKQKKRRGLEADARDLFGGVLPNARVNEGKDPNVHCSIEGSSVVDAAQNRLRNLTKPVLLNKINSSFIVLSVDREKNKDLFEIIVKHRGDGLDIAPVLRLGTGNPPAHVELSCYQTCLNVLIFESGTKRVDLKKIAKLLLLLVLAIIVPSLVAAYSHPKKPGPGPLEIDSFDLQLDNKGKLSGVVTTNSDIPADMRWLSFLSDGQRIEVSCAVTTGEKKNVCTAAFNAYPVDRENQAFKLQSLDEQQNTQPYSPKSSPLPALMLEVFAPTKSCNPCKLEVSNDGKTYRDIYGGLQTISIADIGSGPVKFTVNGMNVIPGFMKLSSGIVNHGLVTIKVPESTLKIVSASLANMGAGRFFTMKVDTNQAVKKDTTLTYHASSNTRYIDCIPYPSGASGFGCSAQVSDQYLNREQSLVLTNGAVYTDNFKSTFSAIIANVSSSIAGCSITFGNTGWNVTYLINKGPNYLKVNASVDGNVTLTAKDGNGTTMTVDPAKIDVNATYVSAVFAKVFKVPAPTPAPTINCPKFHNKGNVCLGIFTPERWYNPAQPKPKSEDVTLLHNDATAQTLKVTGLYPAGTELAVYRSSVNKQSYLRGNGGETVIVDSNGSFTLKGYTLGSTITTMLSTAQKDIITFSAVAPGLQYRYVERNVTITGKVDAPIGQSFNVFRWRPGDKNVVTDATAATDATKATKATAATDVAAFSK